MDLDLKIFDDGELTDGVYTITDVRGLNLAVRKEGNGYAPELTAEDGSVYQQFKLQSQGNGKWRISPVADDRYSLDICGCSNKDGAKLIVYPNNDTSAQKFRIDRDGEGFRILTAASSFGKYLGNRDGLVQTSVRDDRSLWAFHSV